MRSSFTVLFACLAFALTACAAAGLLSRRVIGKAVALLDLALLPPVIGNLLIVSSSQKSVAVTGSYIYYIGMDFVMFALAKFTAEYCRGAGNGQKIPVFVYALLIIDAVQLLLNPIFGHAFTTEQIVVEDALYFRLVPLAGQTFHRIVDYGIFIAVICVYVLLTIKAPKVYRERYSIILLTMIVTGLWQTFYIFSRTPVDRSMIGFGVFGILIFYFALYYRPLRLLDRMLSGIAAEMSDALFVFDPNGNCVWTNDQGCSIAEITDSTLDRAVENLSKIFDISCSSEFQMTEKVIGSGNTARYFMLEEHQVKDEKQKLAGSYLRIRETTAERQKLRRELYDATHDSLTGLYTKAYLCSRIADKLFTDPDTEYLIIFVNIRNFKIVNHVFGSDFGDYALQRLAKWGQKHLSSRCVYGRLGGDTFGFCVPKAEFDEKFIEEKLSGFIVKYNRAEYHLLIHMGVYTPEKNEKDVPLMFERAHLALSSITDEYNRHIAYYDNEIRQKLLWDQKISAELHDAIHSRQVCPYLQPIADENGRIVGAEALARWNHPEHGFLSPVSFIPVFEKNGMIVEIDKYMWRCACEILQRWKQENRDLFLSVNISPKDFYFIDVVSEIKALVEEYGIEPSSLRVEITETVMMDDAENRMETLNQLRESGFVVEMDDFGSGYSSLNMLKDMPVDVLKIDMKFLGRTKDKQKAHIIVKNIINLSKELGITALTEGVETQGQYESLSDIGCKLFQGFYFSKPIPEEEFLILIENEKNT